MFLPFFTIITFSGKKTKGWYQKQKSRLNVGFANGGYKKII